MLDSKARQWGCNELWIIHLEGESYLDNLERRSRFHSIQLPWKSPYLLAKTGDTNKNTIFSRETWTESPRTCFIFCQQTVKTTTTSLSAREVFTLPPFPLYWRCQCYCWPDPGWLLSSPRCPGWGLNKAKGTRFGRVWKTPKLKKTQARMKTWTHKARERERSEEEKRNARKTVEAGNGNWKKIRRSFLLFSYSKARKKERGRDPWLEGHTGKRKSVSERKSTVLWHQMIWFGRWHKFLHDASLTARGFYYGNWISKPMRKKECTLHISQLEKYPS